MLSESTIRINAGGDTYTDISGNVWAKDAYFTTSDTSATNKPISGSSDPLLYQTERSGKEFSYNIPISSSGTYTVNLDFAEIFWSSPGQRVFDVNIEGESVIKNLDILAQAGVNTALRKSVDVQVTDGTLNIDFLASVDNAKVSDIEVIPMSEPTPLATLQATAPAVAIRLEAENMALTNYKVESNSVASGGKVVSLSGKTGTATTTFNGAAGIYNIVAGYYDENDGVGNFAVNIGGKQVDTWNLDQNLGSNKATTQTFVRRTVATALALKPGDLIAIKGTQNKSEYARFDYIEFLSPNQTDSTPPKASLAAANITTSGGKTQNLTVSYTDNVGVNVSTLDSQDIVVTGPNGYKPSVTLVNVNTNNNGTPRTATYQFTAPGGSWDAADNGTYTVSVQANQVSDTSNNYLQSGTLGTFTVNISSGNSLTTPGIWDSPAKMPVSLGEVSSGVINGIIYVVGEANKATLAYNVASGTWSNVAVRPLAGNHHAAEVFNGKLYLLGGLGSGANGKVQIYDPVTNKWSLGANMPFAPGSSSSAVINGEIYVAGGIIGSSTTNQVAKYNPSTNTWTMLAPMKQGLNHSASGTDGSKLYIFGGRQGGNSVSNGFDTVEIYDPATNTWTSSLDAGSSLKPLPQARGGTGKAAYLNGEFYVMGGETRSGGGTAGNGVYNRVDIYNPKTNTWRVGKPMPTARHGIFPVVYGGEIWVAGGGVKAAYSNSNVFEVF